MKNVLQSGSIGVFDSGVGGLSVWREIVRRLPQENTIYFADQIHMPYGPRSKDEIAEFCDQIARFLFSQGCKALVVACNTASAAALKILRTSYPEHPIIGMEPAVKPAASVSQSKIVGILATSTTFQGRLYEATTKRHAANIQLIEQSCPGLAEVIERGQVCGDEIETLLRVYLAPILNSKADTLVLACTHYPFAIETIRRLIGKPMSIIDPAPAIARYLDDVLREKSLLNQETGPGSSSFYTTGVPYELERVLLSLLGLKSTVRAVRVKIF